MTIVHFSTEVTGGAGAFAASIHMAMRQSGMTSVLVTRENNCLEDSITLKPLTRWGKSLRARRLAILGRLGWLDNKYATFGIETSLVEFGDIQNALVSRRPCVFIFYWISYFVDFDCMSKLRQTYPEAPFLLVCLDEGYLGGGCHYSWGCRGYEGECDNCPSTSLRLRKRKIQMEMMRRISVMRYIDPIVLYPTTTMARMGKRSASLMNLRSAVIPLGAVSRQEQRQCLAHVRPENKESAETRRKLTILVRSSSEYRKGCDLFVEAIRLLAVDVSDICSSLRVISIGDATLENSGIGEYVDHEFKGTVQRSQLMEIYREIDALIVTSREDAGPLMINECVALGKFVISTPVGVASDLLTDWRYGMVVAAFSGEAICAALKSYYLHSQSVDAVACVPEGHRLSYDGYVEAMLRVLEGYKSDTQEN